MIAYLKKFGNWEIEIILEIFLLSKLILQIGLDI